MRDKRRGDGQVPGVDPGSIAPPRRHGRNAEVDGTAELEAAAELDVARRQADEYLAALQRERAEFVNFRRRTTEERERDLGLAGEDLLRKVIAVADDFDRAIDARPDAASQDESVRAWAEGITAIDRKLRLLLESEGVKPIEALPGQAFDPREHDAIANVPGSGRREGEIVEEVRRGYRVRDRVLRPALVAVASPTEQDQIPEPDQRPN